LCDNFCKAKPLTHETVGIYALTGFSVPSFPNTRNGGVLEERVIDPGGHVGRDDDRPHAGAEAVETKGRLGDLERVVRSGVPSPYGRVGGDT
jgi:hypothetical protein